MSEPTCPECDAELELEYAWIVDEDDPESCEEIQMYICPECGYEEEQP